MRPEHNESEPLQPTRHGADETVEIAAFLARQQGGSAAWQSFLELHPQHAEHLARQLSNLQQHGILGAAMPVPDQVGPFLLMRRLGIGGMGVVYLARDDRDREAAVKMVRPDLLASASARTRFDREIAVLRDLDHPGIVRFLASGEQDGVPWLATEYLPGRSLAELIAEAVPLPPHEAGRSWPIEVACLLQRVAAALQHAHAHGITHRDVKPTNIRILPDGSPVLIDFGLARQDAATTITHSNMLVGSVPYMAPELLRHGGEPTASSDVYALGVVLYEALTGAPPFQGENFASIRSQILDAAPPPLRRLRPRLPQELAEVCGKAMDPDPRHRYASAAEFGADLGRVIANQRILGRPAPARVRAARWLRRRPLRSIALATSVLLTMIVPSVYALQQAAALRASHRLTDLHLVRELAEREPLLWPLHPELLHGQEGLLGWLETASLVVQRLPEHQEALGQVRKRGRRVTSEEGVANSEVARRLQASLRGHEQNLAMARATQPPGWQDWVAELELHAHHDRCQLEEVHSWQFESQSDAQEHRRLATLIVALEDLPRLRRRVEQRVAWIRELEGAMQAKAADWKVCTDAIADVSRHPEYRGLRLQPIFGLAPVGQDPASKLFEFAHLASGPAVVRDAASGRLLTTADTGIVLVLLPGGEVRVGADPDGGPHYDPAARDNERPSHLFSCDPFLIAKFELTHAQWQRFENSRSLYKPGYVPPGETPVTLRHPVDGISKVDMQRVARQMGLGLPTSRQWEYAARGGTTGPWWTGADSALLLTAEVLRGEGQPPPGGPRAVGSGAPNPFGLYDVLGNVEEWCADSVRSYSAEAPGAGDGRSGNLDTGTIRGGSYRERELPRVGRRRDEPAASPLAGARLVLRLR